MVSLAQLWLPIVLAAVGVFVSSTLVHMVFKWHNADYWKLPDEDVVRAAIRKGVPAPGQYMLPFCKHGPEMNTPEAKQKYAEGPVGLLYLRRNGAPHMGGTLGMWFVFTLVISFFAAYVASATLASGTPPMQVFRVVAIVAFLAYAGGAGPNAIWVGLPWRAALKDILDGAIYGAVTGGIFAWMWPH